MQKKLGVVLGTAAIVTATVVGGLRAQAQDQGDHHSPSSGSHAVALKPNTIRIRAYAFTVPKHVAPGSTVRVVNRDQDGHTVTSNDGTSFDLRLGSLEKGRFKAPMKPGSYPFRCLYHSTMKGVLVVK